MANRKISDLTALTAPATGDLLPIVDISEAASADKNKKITIGELFASIPLGSAAAPSIAFEGDSNTGIYSPGADTLAFAVGGTERTKISLNGQHNIFSSDNGLVTRVTAGPGTTVAIHYGTYSATNNTNGTVSFVVWSNGNVQNTNNSYGAYSDAKLKENIVDANSQWDDLKALQVRNYNLKEGQTHKQIGLVAQEVEPVSPGLVYESPDRDEEGNDLGTVTKSVNYSVLYMKAVKALQEAMERIEALEARLSALEAA
jgi:hypothetical protein